MHTNSRGFISFGAILAIIAVIGIAGGAGWYATYKQNTVQSVSMGGDSASHLTTGVKSQTPATASTKIYRNNTYGFEVTYPSGWEVVPNPHTYEQDAKGIVLFNPFPGAQRDVVTPTIWVWKSVPKYGSVNSIDELEKALNIYYSPDILHFSVIEKNGFTFTQVDGIPGLVGEPSAFVLIPQGVLGIYGSDDSFLERIKKI